MIIHRVFCVACLALVLRSAAAQAQDRFIIEVYGHRPEPVGSWMLEAHANYVARGTTSFDGTVAPSNRQLHLGLEVSRGLIQGLDVAGYLLAARRPGLAPDYAGWKLRARAVAPASWTAPVGLGLTVEAGHLRPAYGDDDLTIEVAPILGMDVGRFELTLNPTVERGLRSVGPSEWEFEPSARAVWAISSRVEFDVEYHGALGDLDHLEPIGNQRHILYPSVTLKLGDDLEWNIGPGLGLTTAGDRVAIKTRFEMPLR